MDTTTTEGAPPEPTDRLAERNRQILLGLAAGETAAETGARIGLAPKTVADYRQRIYGELGARNAPHAVALAICTGAINVATTPAPLGDA